MKPVLSVGYNKDSEMDFVIKTEIMNFSNGEMKDFRAMTMVAIGACWLSFQEVGFILI